MSAGIYMNNGVLAYSMDLEKKLKRRKNAIIIEEYKGNATGADLESELQKMLNKHQDITKKEEISEDRPFKYVWKNKINGYTIHSIYPTLDNIPNINKEEWLQVTTVGHSQNQ